MEIQQFKEVSTRIYSDVKEVTHEDASIIKKILTMESITYGRIRTYNEKDSNTIILLSLKQNSVILMKFLLENKIELPAELMDAAVGLLCTDPQLNDTNSTSDPIALLEIERISKQIYHLIIDILYISGYSNEELKRFLTDKNMIDDISVNLVPLIDCEYKSYEMTVLNKLTIGPVLLSIIRVHKDKLRKLIKRRIINRIKEGMSDGNNTIQYAIFDLINEDEHLDLLESLKRVEQSVEFVGFITSLIQSKRSAGMAYERIKPVLDSFEEAITILTNTSETEERKIQPADEKMLVSILKCINKLVKYKSANFYKFIQPAHRMLRMNVGPKIKGHLYNMLAFYSNDLDVYVEKVYSCSKELEEEQKTREYFLLPSLIKFVNAMRNREIKENAGNEMDGGETKDELAIRVAGIRSEDPESLLEALEVELPAELLKLNSASIRSAMLKSEAVIARIVEYQLEHKMVIDDVSIVNLISSTFNPLFFKYASLFSDFSFYLNENVLEQIGNNLEEGIKWLTDCFSREIGEFVRSSALYFNELILRNKYIQPKLAILYEKILAEYLSSSIQSGSGNFEILASSKDEPTNGVEGTRLLLLDDRDLVSDSFFRIFAMQLLHAKLVTDSDCSKFILRHRYSHPGYILYVKTKYISTGNANDDVEFLKKNLIDIDELVGYLSISGQEGLSHEGCTSILSKFGNVDSAEFVQSFGSASEFEKFVLLFGLKEMDKQCEAMIKEEIMANLKTKNRVYFRMLVMQLFKCSDCDGILRLIESVCEDKELLLRLCIHNIARGGRYSSRGLMMNGSTKLVKDGLFLLYYSKIWDRDAVAEIAERLDEEGSEHWKYLLRDIREARYTKQPN